MTVHASLCGTWLEILKDQFSLVKAHLIPMSEDVALRSIYALVICIPGTPRAGVSGDTAGLKCLGFTSDESWQCRGCAAVLISHQCMVTLIQIRY